MRSVSIWSGLILIVFNLCQSAKSVVLSFGVVQIRAHTGNGRAGFVALLAPAAVHGQNEPRLTEEAVLRAIERAQKFLIRRQAGDGSWAAGQGGYGVGVSSLALLAPCVLVFIFANLSVGFTFSTLARSQMQAMQMSMFFFLPSMLLSGFLFPFRGMPEWAQVVGSVFPLTHFLRIVRGILLKGSGWSEIAPELWPILLFMLAAGAVALNRYRETLD